MIALGWWWLGSHPTLPPPPTPLTSTVSPETPTVDGREASSPEASNWTLIDGVARTPDDDSSEATPNSPSSACYPSSRSWILSYEKADAETSKRKADAIAENFDQMRRQGRHSAFIAVEAVPEQLPSDAAADGAAMEQPDSSS
jgi:hypothetical protein